MTGNKSNWKKRVRIIAYTVILIAGMMSGTTVFGLSDIAGTFSVIGNEITFYDLQDITGTRGNGYVKVYTGHYPDTGSGVVLGSTWSAGGNNPFVWEGQTSPCIPNGDTIVTCDFGTSDLFNAIANNFANGTNESADFWIYIYDTNFTPTDTIYYYDGLHWTGTGVIGGPQTATRITSTIPTNGQIIATSTTVQLSYTGYVNDNDYNNGSRATVHIYNNVGKMRNLVGPSFALMISGQNSFDETYVYDIPDAGPFAPPTQTESIQTTGKYFMDFKIEKSTDNWYNVFDWERTTVYSTTTSFTVATTTQYDQLIKDTQDQIVEWGNAVATSTSSYCNLTSFQWYGCVNAVYMVLFVPSTSDFEGYVTELRDDVYARAPLGYIKRFQELLATTTQGTLPALDYTFSTSSRSILSPILGGERIHFEPFDNATGTVITSITSDGANGLPEKSLWEILEPFYTTVIYLGLILLVIGDLMNIDIIDTNGTGANTTRPHLAGDAYKYREKLYKMSLKK